MGKESQKNCIEAICIATCKPCSLETSLGKLFERLPQHAQHHPRQHRSGLIFVAVRLYSYFLDHNQ
jgi:hypothetical protein